MDKFVNEELIVKNAGIRIASGKYIFFLDADDVLTENTIKDCVRQIDKIYKKTNLLTYSIEPITKKLLQKCYNSVILDHPKIDYFKKFYLMRLKGSDTIQTECSPGQIRMYSEGHLVF